MNWDLHVADAESLLEAARIPSSLEIITLIKRINPTKLQLSETDRERGYRLKNALQNLLLEHYGETFHLAPHPCSSEVVLIKHNALPSIDACHALLGAISEKALRTVAAPEEISTAKHPPKEKRKRDASPPSSPKDAVKEAQRLLEEFDYARAEELLTGILIESRSDLPSLVRAANILIEEIGAYGAAIKTLLSQPRRMLKDEGVRELLALAYYRNGMIPEARALFEALHSSQFGKNSLCAYADICIKDGNLAHAYHLLKEADGKEGFVVEHALLKTEVAAAMLAEAQPWLQKAEEALRRDDMEQAESISREALARYPSLQRAGEIIAQVNARREAEELAEIWNRFERSDHSGTRLDLLEMLLERDEEHREKVASLLAAEKAAMKKEMVASRLEALRKEAAGERWRDCYSSIEWLSRQTDHGESYRAACALSPHFHVLYQNRRLQKAPEKSAQEAWLRFVEAKSRLQAGKREGCFEIMEGIRYYFEQDPEFAEDYRILLACEQESARSEITDLLRQVEGDDGNCDRVCAVFNRIRKRMTILPGEERRAYEKIIQDRLAQFKPELDNDSLLNAYGWALSVGNRELAAWVREVIPDPESLEPIEAEVAELLRLDATPLTLAFSDDVPVDLASEPPLFCVGATDRHIFLMHTDGDGSLILVDLATKSATRLSSYCLSGMHLVDALSERGIFLFRGSGEGEGYVARVELTGTKIAMTAIFDMTESFLLEEGITVVDIYLSSERDNDYYLNTRHKDGVAPGTMGRQRLRNRNGMMDALRINNEPRLYSWRLSSEPDKFIIGAKDETRICARNLTLDLAIRMPPEIWEVDELNRHIYHFYGAIIERSDFRLENSTKFPHSAGSFFFKDSHRIEGVCPATNTVLLSFGRREAVYDFGSNNLSAPFPLGMVVSTRPARQWYCYAYKKDALELTLRDVTHELGTLLEWKKLVLLKSEGYSEERSEETYDQLYFGYRPEDNPNPPPPPENEVSTHVQE